MISVGAAVQAVILLVVCGLILGLLNWLIDYCEVPQPFHKAAKVVLAIVSVIVIIGVLLSLAGYQVFRP